MSKKEAPLLQIKSVSKRFSALVALNQISLEIPAARVTGLVGPNGCGKTTLIKSILGLCLPDGGEISIRQQDILNQWEYRKDLGYMPQNPEFPAHLRTDELFDFLEDLRGVEAPARKELVELFLNEQDRRRPLGVLSGGTKQKIAAIAAFMFNAPLLILDEPTVGLDPLSAVKFKSLVRRRAQAGAAILFVSHIMAEVEELAEHLLFLLDGKIQYSGTLKDLRNMGIPGRPDDQWSLEDSIVNLLGKSDLPTSTAPRI